MKTLSSECIKLIEQNATDRYKDQEYTKTIFKSGAEDALTTPAIYGSASLVKQEWISVHDRTPDLIDGNYEPSNCRWATSKEQIQNRRI